MGYRRKCCRQCNVPQIMSYMTKQTTGGKKMLIALITIALFWIVIRILLFFFTLPFKILGLIFSAPVFLIIMILLIIMLATSC